MQKENKHYEDTCLNQFIVYIAITGCSMPETRVPPPPPLGKTWLLFQMARI